MSETILSHDTEHEGMINDSQFDFYGTRLATADSNGVVKICRVDGEIANGSVQLVDQDFGGISAHQGPCWQVTWAHPKYESVVATCGYDRQIKIWKEVSQNQWKCVYKVETQASVNTIQFAPWEYGLYLAAGVADGKVHIISHIQGTWQETQFQAHNSGINGVAWGPSTEPCLLMAENIDYMNQQKQEKSYNLINKRFVTGSMDGKAKIWQENTSTGKFDQVAELLTQKNNTHDDWVRDVAWCSNIGTMKDVIATVGEDQKLKIWTNQQTSKDAGGWALSWEKAFAEPVWKCSFSPVGFMLAISCGDNQTRVFKADNDDQWQVVSQINEKGELHEAEQQQQQIQQ